MRKRNEVESDGARKDILCLEILLDIRDLLKKTSKPKKPRKNKKEVK